MSWPVGLRRAAILAFPLALPLWLAAVAGRAAMVMLADGAGIVHAAWTRPPRRRCSDYYGRHRGF